MVAALVKVILAMGEEDKADAVIFATVDISNEVVIDVNLLHLFLFLFLISFDRLIIASSQTRCKREFLLGHEIFTKFHAIFY